MASALGKGIDIVSRNSGIFASILMFFAAIITCYEIIARHVFKSPTSWTLEVSIFILIWFGFLSTAYTQREGRHICVDILISRFSPRTRAMWEVMTTLFSLFFIVMFSYYSYDFFVDAVNSHETTLGVFVAPVWVPKLALFVGGAIWGLQVIKDIVVKIDTLRTQSLEKGYGLKDNPLFIAIVFLALLGIALWLYKLSPLGGLLLLVLLLLFGGVPVFAALGLAGIAGLFIIYGGLSALSAIPNVAYGALYNFTLVCLPLFMMAGQLLVDSGAGQELYDLCNKWLGHLPGGLAIATIVACAVFAAISVSSMVVAITIGLVALPALIARGYDKRFSYGVLAAGGTLGIMIPPSGTMIVYSAVTDESLGKLFIAGLIPGIILVALFIGYAVFFSRKGGFGKARPYSWKERFSAFKTGIWVLLAPTIILVGIYSGIFTVTEAGAVVVIYALVMGLARRKIKMSQVPQILGQSSVNGGMVLVLFVGALLLGLFMTLLQVPNTVVHFVAAANIPGWAVIAALMLGYIVLGMFLEVISIMLITLPVVYPLIVSLGFDGIWFAVLVTLNMELAQITPPVGMNLYVIRGIFGAPFEDVIKGLIPFFVIMLIGLIIFGIFPQLSTWLPSIMIK